MKIVKQALNINKTLSSALAAKCACCSASNFIYKIAFYLNLLKYQLVINRQKWLT